jgi:hypothetical protein
LGLWASCRAAARVAKVWLGQLPPCAPCAADQCLVGIGYFPSRRRSSGACHSANGGYADIVAAGEFVERSALHTATAGLFLLYRSECRASAHVLSLGLGAASAVGGAGADKVALHVASPPNTAIISRPVLVPVSAHGSASERNCGLASTICLTMANRSKVLRAKAVNARYRHHVAGGEGVQHFEELAAVVVCASHLLAENLGAAHAA